jgi:hypothetical protein
VLAPIFILLQLIMVRACQMHWRHVLWTSEFSQCISCENIKEIKWEFCGCWMSMSSIIV